MAGRRKKTDFRQQKPHENTIRSTFPFLQRREDEIALVSRLLDRADQGGATLVISGGSTTAPKHARSQAIICSV